MDVLIVLKEESRTLDGGVGTGKSSLMKGGFS